MRCHATKKPNKIFVVDKDTNNIDYTNDDDDNYVNGNGKWMW